MFGCVGKTRGAHHAVLCHAAGVGSGVGRAALFQWAWPAAVSVQKYEWGFRSRAARANRPCRTFRPNSLHSTVPITAEAEAKNGFT